MYSIVEFITENNSNKECEIVPTCWINENNCRWPHILSREKFNNYVKERRVPEASWKSYPVRVLRTFATYEKAEARLPSALIESNIESQSDQSFIQSTSSSDEEEVIKKKKRKVTRALVQTISVKSSKNAPASSTVLSVENERASSSSVSKSGNITLTATPSSCRELQVSTQIASENTASTGTPVSTKVSQVTQSASENIAPTGTPTSSRALHVTQSANSTFELKVIELLTSLCEEQRENKVLLQELLRNSRRSAANILEKPEDFPSLPCQNIPEFEYLEQHLLINSNYDYMRQFLVSLGGTNAQVATRKMLKECITNEVGQEFNWKGRGKKSFQTTKLKEVIFDSVKRSNPTATEHLVASVIKDWLKYSKARINSQNKPV